MNQSIEASFQWRYATKAFDPKGKISTGDWETLKQSLIQAPSSYGLQPWKFIVVQNTELRTKLRAVSWNQTQVTDASHYVVFATRDSITEQDVDRYVSRIAEVRGSSIASLAGYRDMMIGDLVKGPRSSIISFWAQRQAYIAMGFLMETAALLKIDSCPMEGLDPKAYDDLLNLRGTGYQTVAACALGYRSAEDKYQHAPKVRYPESALIEVRV
jgi:nitroreductase